MAKLSKITPCLWFDSEAEEAAQFYTSVFPDGRITGTLRYSEAGQEHHGRAPGSVMTVSFELAGQSVIALNGGPAFRFNEAVSLMILCDTQEEIDHYWTTLGEGGDPTAQMCGWLKDRYGLSWQVAPAMFPELYADENSAGAQRAMLAMMGMKKLDIAALQAAFKGE
ncbi:VOC family protein [Pseudoduganella plicata]|uniref:VOC family protein n=1 Tax=Pseudoduganella plicata TaxID=321984 RepID=A0A4P7BAW9_9BURK|nr:VOC family protein [Pseudoduganella plicata]QBQ35270.1 VOC family protein [Pseudoduganella plicata]GGZ00364.1 VOC family protein [Pseudoduganella plicata]